MGRLSKQLSALKQGDPRAVTLVAALVFLLSVCWFAWTFLHREEARYLPLGAGGGLLPSDTPAFSLTAELERQRAPATTNTAPNPFHRDPPPREARTTGQTRNTPRAPSDRQSTPRRPPSSLPPRPGGNPARPPSDTGAPTFQVLYRGVLTRPDGATVALLANPESGAMHYLQVGERSGLLTLVSVSPRTVEIRIGDQAPVTLTRGEPRTFTHRP